MEIMREAAFVTTVNTTLWVSTAKNVFQDTTGRMVSFLMILTPARVSIYPENNDNKIINGTSLKIFTFTIKT